MKKLVLFFVISTYSLICAGQEFEFEVKVNPLTGMLSDPPLFSELETEIYELFNSTKWTDDEFRNVEKIKGSLQLNIIEEPQLGNFVGELIIQTIRPVYQSSYETTLINTIDKTITFSFIKGQPLRRSDIQFLDRLSSVLTFYAHMILGFEYDSFSPLGGDKYFLRAQELLITLPRTIQDNDPGWKSGLTSGRNKFWMVMDQLDPRLKVYRNVFYEYHRLYLDRMAEDPDLYRASMLSSLRTLEGVVKNYPNSMALNMFGDAKGNEIVDIFVDAPADQKKKIYDLMMLIQPSLSAKYASLKR